MIKVKVVRLRTNELLYWKSYFSLNDLREAISKITFSDLRSTDYQIQKTPRVLEFLKRTYVGRFLTEFDEYVSLTALKNGQKRVKNYRKKTNSNRILENTLLRIQNAFDKKLKKHNITATVIMPNMFNDKNEIIKIDFTEKKERHVCIVSFDKVKWTFNIVKIETSKPKLLINIINKVFSYTTTPTRIYREKHKVIENENNAK